MRFFIRTTVCLTLVGVLLQSVVFGAASPDYKSTQNLLDTSQTVIGEDIHYPGGGQARIKAMVVVLEPGERTVWHRHGVPLYAYLLAGDLELDYGPAGKRIYHRGDNFMEAMNEFHQGHNIGLDQVRILAVFMGGEGQPLVIPKE